MKKAIYILFFLLISCLSYGQTKVTIKGGNEGGSGTATEPTVTTSSATTLSLTTATTNEKTYVYTGTSAVTWTLPNEGTASKFPIRLKNRGTGIITLSGNIYSSAVKTSISILPGEAYTVQSDGTYWLIN